MSAAKRIGPALATVLVAGNMVGSGVFLLPASLAAIGSSTVIGWVVTTAGCMLLAGVFAVLAATRPDPDGLVNWPAKRIHPAAGFVAWAAYWITGWAGNVAIGLAAVGYLASLYPPLKSTTGTVLSLLTVIWVFTGLVLLGARVVTRFSAMTLAIGLLPIAAAIVLGFAGFSPRIFMDSWNVTGRPLLETVPASLSVIVWAFLGLECANIASAVVDNPKRNVPIAALSGVALAGLVYILASVAVMGVIPAKELAVSTAPFAEVVSRVAGPAAGAAVAICAALKAFGTVSGWFLVSGECGRSGAAAGYLPSFMSESDPNVLPRRGLLILAVLMSLVALGTASPTLNTQFNILMNLTVMLMLGVYSLCALALVLDGTQKTASRMLGIAGFAFCLWAAMSAGLNNMAPALGILGTAALIGLGIDLFRRRVPALPADG